MASRIAAFCDAVLADLKDNVPALNDLIPHRYAPWDPEQLLAEAGETHVAVYPAAEATDRAEPLVSDGGTALVRLYRVLVWENAGDESSRGIADEEAALDMIELLEAVRDRFYVRANVSGAAALGGVEFTQFVEATMPDRSGRVRYFQLAIQARTSKTLT